MALRQEEFTRLCDDVDLDRDRILVERCQAGDPGAFGSLYARYYERLLRFCLRRLHDRHEAEDAAQEAFARAWKALPNFAGERRFYPWLTVIAGNICTDMLRRRSRSTPTEDVELGARPPLGVTSAPTADEMIIAAADGDLAHRALERLSVRHRHVLALREDSGWTYQQIADHEGVEIGTIETLLWRARQALKREFLALSESKGALAGFLVGAGVTFRTVVMRSTHRAAALQPGGGSGAFRNVLAGFAVTSVAVTAAFVTPHAFDSAHQAPVPLPSAAAVGAPAAGHSMEHVTPSAGSASGGQPATTPNAPSYSSASIPAGYVAAGSSTVAGLNRNAAPATREILSGVSESDPPVAGLTESAQSLLPQGLIETVASGAAGLNSGASDAVSGTLAPPLKALVPATVGTISAAVGGLGSALGAGSSTSQTGSASSGAITSTTTASTTTTTSTLPLGLGSVASTVSGLLGQP